MVLATAPWGTAQAGPAAPLGQIAKSAHTVREDRAADGAFTAAEAGEGRYEVTFSGRQLRSREQVERYLLYRAALLAKQRGYSWFLFLHLPGEGGPEDHPVRWDSAINADYGHWQPHWSYHQRGVGWQPWRPEWGTPFWTNEANPKDVDQYEAHAMIELRSGEIPSGALTAFNAEKVLGDLEPITRSIGP